MDPLRSQLWTFPTAVILLALKYIYIIIPVAAVELGLGNRSARRSGG